MWHYFAFPFGIGENTAQGRHLLVELDNNSFEKITELLRIFN